MSDKHPPQQTGSSSEAGAPEATILRGTSKATTPPLRGTSKATTPPLRGTPPYQEGSRKNSPPAKGEYPEGGRGLIPKLRFPEFRKAGTWEVKKLIDTSSKKIKWSFIGGPFGSNLKSSDYVGNGIRVIQLQNIGDAEFIDNYRIFTSIEKADELLSNNIYPGDIILSKMGDPVGRACLIPNTHNRYVMCSDGIRLVVDENAHSKYFVYLLINSTQFRSLVEKTATGSTRKRIGLDDLKNLPMTLPSKGEQQKIADCLSSLDTLITAQAEKIEALKTHKKGLMQQLFPQDGETVPRLRFSEFRDAGEWEETTLGEIVEVASGQVDPMEPPYNDMPHVGGENIESHTGNLQGVSTARELGLISGKYLFDERDVLYSKIRPALNKVAIPGFRGICSADIYPLRPSSQKLCRQYLAYVLLSEEFVKYATKNSDRSKIPKVNRDSLLAYKLVIPSPPEQQRIADCVSSLDMLITAETEKLDALKTHKKSLMQQLFPAVENEAGS
jgi:type I restriction enzyme S subunit